MIIGMGINGVDANGWSALHHASANNHIDMVVYLIKEGIKLDIQDLQGYTVCILFYLIPYLFPYFYLL